jgi:hypothetical protein
MVLPCSIHVSDVSTSVTLNLGFLSTQAQLTPSRSRSFPNVPQPSTHTFVVRRLHRELCIQFFALLQGTLRVSGMLLILTFSDLVFTFPLI